MRDSAATALVAALLTFGAPAAAQWLPLVGPFVVERSDGGTYANPFAGGLMQPRTALRDANGDGNPDLFTLNPDGHLRFYRNDGDLHFVLVQPSPWDTAPVQNWFRFADLDGDGADDLLTGGARSEVLLYHNTGTTAHPIYPVDGDTVRGADGRAILMQRETVPSLVDIDGDGDLDFFNGKLDGSITYYENTGTPQTPVFTYRTDSYAGILVISTSIAGGDPPPPRLLHGASVLDFADLNDDGDLDMLFGDYFTSKMLVFTNTGSRTAPSFGMDRLDTAFAPEGDIVVSDGFNQPTVGDVDGDGDPDVVVSSLLPFSTTDPLVLYRNDGTASHMLMHRIPIDLTGELDVGTNAAPAPIADQTHRGMLVGSTAGALTYLADVGDSSATIWRLALRLQVGSLLQTAPAAADLDGDGTDEVVVGDATGHLALFEFSQNRLVSVSSELDLFKANQNAVPAFGDLDGDGDQDLLVGAGNGTFSYLENVGTPTAPSFVAAAAPSPFDTLDVGNDAAPRLFDLDGDGDLDAIVGARSTGSATDRVRFYRNDGGRFVPFDRYGDLMTVGSPVPAVLRLPEGTMLFIGTRAGGLLALRDTAAVSRVSVGGRGENSIRIRSTLGGVTITAPTAGVLEWYDLLGRRRDRRGIRAGTTRTERPAGAPLWRFRGADGTVELGILGPR